MNDYRAFMHEAQTWADVHDHPHIPTVIGWDDEPQPWLAVEYADHGSLGEYTDDTDTPLGVHQAVWTVQCLAKALDHAHAHARDHYHQDVTPYNVLLFTSEDGWAVPKLGDWGLARARNDQSSQSFTPGYAAPEQRQPDQYYRVHPPQNRSLPTRDDPLRTAD
jgi:serine/threonine protein kinase